MAVKEAAGLTLITPWLASIIRSSLPISAAAARPSSTAKNSNGKKATPSSCRCGHGTNMRTHRQMTRRFCFRCMMNRFCGRSVCTGKKIEQIKRSELRTGNRRLSGFANGSVMFSQPPGYSIFQFVDRRDAVRGRFQSTPTAEATK